MISTLKRLIYTGKQSKTLYILCAQYMLIGFLSVLSTGSIGFITQGTLSFDSQLMKLSIFVLIGASLFETLLTWRSNIKKATMKESMLVEFKDKTARSILGSPYAFSQSLEKGDIIGRLNSDLGSIVVAAELSITVIRSSFILIILLIGMAYFDVRLMLSFAITIPFFFLLSWYIVSHSTANIIPWKNAMGETHALIQELLTNRTTIKAFNLKSRVTQWLHTALSKSASYGIKGISRLYVMNLPQFILMICPSFIITLVGVYYISQGKLSISALVSVFLLSSIAYDQLNSLSNSAQNIPQLLASTQRIFPIWDTPFEPNGNEQADVPKHQPIIEFVDVSFAYPNTPDTPILNNLSLSIYPGEHIGLVGTSGSGKSTVFKLISGLYAPNSGVVKFYGLDVNAWNKDALRKELAVIAQNTFLFEDTLFNNLKLEDQTLTYLSAMDALERVNLATFVNSLPDKLDSEIGEKGSKLSGGQRQRVSIARSILKNAPVVLYDEATSALDSQSEQAIDRLIMSKNNDKTQLVIAHRFSTIKDMDRIIVLDQGRVVEEGTHDDLIHQASLYKKLYEKQGAHDYE